MCHAFSARGRVIALNQPTPRPPGGLRTVRNARAVLYCINLQYFGPFGTASGGTDRCWVAPARDCMSCSPATETGWTSA